MDFHEDCDAPGYYICEIKAQPPFAGEQLIEAVESVLPFQQFGKGPRARRCLLKSARAVL